MKLTDTVGFGKYKHTTYQEALNKDPQYLVWIYTTIPGKLEGEVLGETEKWMATNPVSTKKKIAAIRKASDKAAAEKAAKAEAESEDGHEDPVDGSFVPDPAPQMPTPAVSRPEIWGSW